MMEAIVKGNMEGIKLGEIQIHNHVAVIPFISADGSGPDYLTMKEAMDKQFLVVTEVTEGGAVPELKVINRGGKARFTPRWRGTLRRQAEPGAQHHYPACGKIGNGHPRELHRTRTLVLPFRPL
jgi:hypothetical protein